MIATPRGWTCTARGDSLLLTPPAGVRGVIVYTERMRPLVEPMAIVGRHAPLRDLPLDDIAPPELILTHEGEYALLTSYASGPLVRPHAFVLGDDFYACIAACAPAKDGAFFADVVRRLAETDTHLLGARRRRFLYEPPAGWRGTRVALFHDVWAPAGDRAVELTVHAGLPAQGDDDLGEALRSLAGPGAVRGRRLEQRAGLGGARWEVDAGGGLGREVVVLQDRTYVYPLAVTYRDERRDEARAALSAVLDSLHPLPARRVREDRATHELASHWLA